MEKLKVAVIGCGNISVMHLDAIVALEESELVAVCDIKPDRAEQTAERYGVKAYTDYKQMFECERLDAVHLCLPHFTAPRLPSQTRCFTSIDGVLYLH